MGWLVKESDLSPEQTEAVHASAREHRAIVGAPGSGKTMVLMHRAKKLLVANGVDPSRIHIFIYTNVLADYLRSALKDLDLPLSCVGTFASWCADYHKHNLRGPLPKIDKVIDFQEIERRVLLSLQNRTTSTYHFDFALVDEAQDLDPMAFDILKAIARHITICVDHKQQIYDHGASERDILDRLGLRNSNMTLSGAFRCTKSLVDLAASFITDPVQSGFFRNQCKVDPNRNEQPLLYLADSFEDERQRLIEVVKTRLSKGERIGILFPNNRQVYGFAEGLTESGLEVEIRQEGWKKVNRFPALDFNSQRPKLLTYHSAKGLTFDSVMLPRLVPGSFRRSSIPESNLLFVGITSATQWAFLSTDRNRDFFDSSWIENNRKSGTLAVHDRNTKMAPSTRQFPTMRKSHDGDDLGDLL